MWEYVVEVDVETNAYSASGKLNVTKLEEYLNKQSQIGWEFVTSFHSNSEQDLFIFKRQKQNK